MNNVQWESSEYHRGGGGTVGSPPAGSLTFQHHRKNNQCVDVTNTNNVGSPESRGNYTGNECRTPNWGTSGRVSPYRIEQITWGGNNNNVTTNQRQIENR